MRRKKFSKAFKAKVAIEASKGQHTANELAKEFAFYPNQINRRKKELLESSPEMFSRDQGQESKRLEA